MNEGKNKYYDRILRTCKGAWRWTSFMGEKRETATAEGYGEELEQDLEALKELGSENNNYEEKYLRHLTDWLGSVRNCISPMICGPAKFPFRRAEKARNSEMNKYNKFRQWRARYFKAVRRVPRESPIEYIDRVSAELETMSMKILLV